MREIKTISAILSIFILMALEIKMSDEYGYEIALVLIFIDSLLLLSISYIMLQNENKSKQKIADKLREKRLKYTGEEDLSEKRTNSLNPQIHEDELNNNEEINLNY